MEQPPRFNFIGPFGSHPEAIRLATNHLNDFRPDTPPPLDITAATEAQLDAVVDSALLHGREKLDVDVGNRMPAADKIQLLDEAGYQQVRQTYGRSNGSVALHTMAGDVLAMVAPSHMATLGSVQHEVVHLASTIRLRLDRNEHGGLSVSGARSGYSSDCRTRNPLSVIEEILTEANTLQIIATQWPQQPALAHFQPADYADVGYAPQMIVGEELIRRAGEVGGLGTEGAFRHMTRGKILDDMRGLQPLIDAVGVDGMKKLAGWDVHSSPKADLSRCRRLAEALDLPDAVEKLDAFANGEQVPVMAELAPGFTTGVPPHGALEAAVPAL